MNTQEIIENNKYIASWLGYKLITPTMRKEIINRTNIIDHLIKKELELSGHTITEAVLDSNWTFNFTLTMEQHAEFKKYCIPLLKKVFKYRREKAESTFEFFYTNWGLRIKN